MTSENVARVRRTAGKAVINVAIPVTVILGLIPWLASHGIGLFVYRTDFNDYIATQKFTHSIDSVMYDAKLNTIRADVNTLVRACQKRGECP